MDHSLKLGTTAGHSFQNRFKKKKMLVLYTIDFDINSIYIGVKVNKEYTQQKRRVLFSESSDQDWNFAMCVVVCTDPLESVVKM